MQVSVKDVDEKVFREFKGEAVKEGLKVGQALNVAMMYWVWQREKPMKKLQDFKPIRLGKPHRTSEEIDDILYGKERKS